MNRVISPKHLVCLAFSTLLIFTLISCGGGNTSPSTGGTGEKPINTHRQWVWDSGADADLPSDNPNPVYGILGSADAKNVPGGRDSAAYWKDKNGDFWLFGGNGYDGSPAPVLGLLNDLWKFSPTTRLWTWMGGSSTITSCASEPSSQCGLPGVYGVQGVASPSNNPGGRMKAAFATDSNGHLWLFGGLGADANGQTAYLNDLWQFDPSNNEWAWMSGSDTRGPGPIGQEAYGYGRQGAYGTQGVPDPANVPPGLTSATAWIDSAGNLWLFGGLGVTSSGLLNFFNNLWKFDTKARVWTWVAGDGGLDTSETGTYGSLGVAAPGNLPSARASATGWTDSEGKMWLFGGYGVYPSNQSFTQNALNELWKFDPGTQQWTWVSGTAGGVLNSYGAYVPPASSYGALGIPSDSNVPSGRATSVGWTDIDGNLWLFGGFGSDSTAYTGPLNDLWQFNLAKGQWVWVGGTTHAFQGGVYGTKGIPAPTNVPGTRYSSSAWTDMYGNLWLFGGWGDMGNVTGMDLNDMWRYEP